MRYIKASINTHWFVYAQLDDCTNWDSGTFRDHPAAEGKYATVGKNVRTTVRVASFTETRWAAGHGRLYILYIICILWCCQTCGLRAFRIKYASRRSSNFLTTIAFDSNINKENIYVNLRTYKFTVCRRPRRFWVIQSKHTYIYVKCMQNIEDLLGIVTRALIDLDNRIKLN